MNRAAAITTLAMRLVDQGHTEIRAFALAVVATPCAPAAERLALLTFTAAMRRRRSGPSPASAPWRSPP